MANKSLNEALGRTDSKLLSDAIGTNIEIASVSFEAGKDNEGKDFERAYLTCSNGDVYRSSNKAILTKAHAMSENLPKGSTVLVQVVEKKAKKGTYKYVDFEEPKAPIPAKSK